MNPQNTLMQLEEPSIANDFESALYSDALTCKDLNEACREKGIQITWDIVILMEKTTDTLKYMG